MDNRYKTEPNNAWYNCGSQVKENESSSYSNSSMCSNSNTEIYHGLATYTMWVDYLHTKFHCKQKITEKHK